MARKIVITSGKGGVGKTTIVCGLGQTIARLGYKTLLIDMDFGLNNLDVLTGIENKIVYDIIDVLEGKCLPKQALVQDFVESNLYVFPSTHGFCRVRFGAKELMEIIYDLEKYFDYILIDCPAGIDGGFRRAVDCGNEYILVTTPHLSAVRDVDKTIDNLKKGFNKPYLIINRARGDLMVDSKMLTVKSITDSLNAELLGVIPEDDVVSIQMLSASEFDKDSLIQKSLNMIANNLIIGENNIFDCTKRYRGVIGSIRKNLKKRV